MVGKEDGISVGMVLGCDVTVGECEGLLVGSCVGVDVGTTLKLGFSEGALELLGLIEDVSEEVVGEIEGEIEGNGVGASLKLEGAGEQEGCWEGSVDIVGYIEGLLLKLPLPLPLPFDPPLFPLLLVPLPLLLLPPSPHATDFDDFALLLLLDPFPFPLLLFGSNMMLWKFRLVATLGRSARSSLFSDSSVILFLRSLLAKAFWDSVDSARAITITDFMRCMFCLIPSCSYLLSYSRQYEWLEG